MIIQYLLLLVDAYVYNCFTIRVSQRYSLLCNTIVESLEQLDITQNLPLDSS